MNSKKPRSTWNKIPAATCALILGHGAALVTPHVPAPQAPTATATAASDAYRWSDGEHALAPPATPQIALDSHLPTPPPLPPPDGDHLPTPPPLPSAPGRLA
jgi:hypothetical protein